MPALRDRPTPQWGLELAWEAFWHLSHHGRSFLAAGLGPIRTEAILAYFDTFRITDPEDRAELIELINGLDAVYLKHSNARS